MESEDRPYEMIPHTADLRMRVWGSSIESLFENAARALAENLAEPAAVREVLKEEIRIQALDRAELLVAWLNRILFLWEARRLLFKTFRVHRVTERSLEAEAWGEIYDPSRHRLGSEIKAATYHGLNIRREGSSLVAEIIFDT